MEGMFTCVLDILCILCDIALDLLSQNRLLYVERLFVNVYYKAWVKNQEEKLGNYKQVRWTFLTASLDFHIPLFC